MNGQIVRMHLSKGRIERPQLLRILGAFTLGLPIKLSLMCLICGIVLAARGSSTACITFLQWGLIAIGLFLMAIFIAVMSCFKTHKDGAIAINLLGLFFALIALLSLMIAAFVHINIKDVHDGPPMDNINDLKALDKPQPVREYSLRDYGGKLRRRVADSRYWDQISGCLRHRRNTCGGMSPLIRDPSTGMFLAERTSKTYPGDAGLSPIESGCCKPPLSCGFTYVNQTTWTGVVPANNTTHDQDCSRWNNDQEKLCFQCDSCKAGVLADVQRAWALSAIILTFFTILYIIAYPCMVLALGSQCSGVDD